MIQTRPEVIKLFFMLNSDEHEISTAHKYQNSQIERNSNVKSSKPVIYPADNKNIRMSSFKSSENIQKKAGSVQK